MSGRDFTDTEVLCPTPLMRRAAYHELRARIRYGRAGDEVVAMLLDLYEAAGGPVGDGNYRRWLSGAGFSDDGPEVA